MTKWTITVKVMKGTLPSESDLLTKKYLSLSRRPDLNLPTSVRAIKQIAKKMSTKLEGRYAAVGKGGRGGQSQMGN